MISIADVERALMEHGLAQATVVLDLVPGLDKRTREIVRLGMMSQDITKNIGRQPESPKKRTAREVLSKLMGG